jgi:hypothetical protein
VWFHPSDTVNANTDIKYMAAASQRVYINFRHMSSGTLNLYTKCILQADAASMDSHGDQYENRIEESTS